MERGAIACVPQLVEAAVVAEETYTVVRDCLDSAGACVAYKHVARVRVVRVRAHRRLHLRLDGGALSHVQSIEGPRVLRLCPVVRKPGRFPV